MEIILNHWYIYRCQLEIYHANTGGPWNPTLLHTTFHYDYSHRQHQKIASPHHYWNYKSNHTTYQLLCHTRICGGTILCQWYDYLHQNKHLVSHRGQRLIPYLWVPLLKATIYPIQTNLQLPIIRLLPLTSPSLCPAKLCPEYPLALFRLN